ncbi:hypothetical protein GCM10027168_64300 [Streptomyces capparidis]
MNPPPHPAPARTRPPTLPRPSALLRSAARVRPSGGRGRARTAAALARGLPLTRSRALLAAFGGVSAVHLAALTGDAERAARLTKPALMPMLAAYAAAEGAPRPLVAALLLSACGDVLLQVAGEMPGETPGEAAPFLLGMGCFAAAHVCFVARFLRDGALSSRESRSRAGAAAAVYGAAWLLTLAVLGPGLGELRLPVAGYGLLLAATAVTAAGTGPRAAAGGALFLLSDALIAAGIARPRQSPRARLWVMATYIAGEFLLATGARRGIRAPAPAAAG